MLAACAAPIERSVSPDPSTPWTPRSAALERPTLPEPPYPPELISREEPLDLAQLVNVALSNDPRTSLAWFEAKTAAAKRMEKFALYLPKGHVEFKGSRTDVLADPRITRGSDYGAWNYGFGTVARMLIFDFQGREATIEAATRALDGANFRFNQALQDVVRDVSRFYFDLWVAEESQVAAQTNMADAETTLASAEAKNEAGISPIQDVFRARAQVANAKFQIAQAQSDIQRARANLAGTLALPVTDPFQIVAPDIPIDEPLVLSDVREAMAQALEVKPSLLAAFSEFAAAEELTWAAETTLFPLVVASYSARSSWGGFSRGPSWDQRAAFGIEWAVFDLFKNYYALEQARMEARAVAEVAQRIELETVSQVWKAYYDVKTALEKARARQARLVATRETFELTQDAYDSGLADFLDLETAQRDLADARLDYLRAKGDFAKSRVELAYATGTLAPGEPLPAGKASR